jgi:hypothetical protein
MPASAKFNREEKNPGEIWRPDPLKTDMTARLTLGVGHCGVTDGLDGDDFHSQT